MAIKKVCWHCKHKMPSTDFNRNSSEKDGLQKFCKTCQRVYGRKRYDANKLKEQKRGRDKYKQLKEEIFEHYGKLCKCCGEKMLDFLAIDHVANDGYTHRKTVPGGIRMYYWLKKNNFPEGFQVLCHNCNWSKHINGGTCIHQLS